MATDLDFASELQTALDEHRLSVRGFARLYAGEGASGTAQETARSSINRWLARKHAPSRKSRLKVARTLGEPAERFLDPDERVTPEVLADRLEELADLVDEGIARLEAGIARVERRLERGDGRGRGSK